MILINQINQTFRNSLGNKNYINKKKDEANLINTDVKIHRLSEIFTFVQTQISSQSDLSRKDVSELRALQESGRLLYERYESSTKSWKRIILKGLAKYTPEFLKQYLPSCFSNKIEEAEKETQKAYNKFKDLIENTITTLAPISAENEEEMPLTKITAGLTQDAEKSSHLRLEISKKVEILSNFNRHPLSLLKFKKLLWALAQELICLYSIDPSNDKFFENQGLTKEFSNALCLALNLNDMEKISSLLSNVGWATAFNEAIATLDKSLLLTLQKIRGESILKITDQAGAKVRESQLDHYRGSVELSLMSTQTTDVIDVLIKNLEEKSNFLPHTVRISLSPEDRLAPSLVVQISELIKRGIEVQIHGLSRIDLQELSQENRSLFFDGSSPQLLLPDLSEIVSADSENFTWSDDALTYFLRRPEIYNKIKILDLKGCLHLTTDILFFLTTFPCLDSLSLPDLPKGKNALNMLPRFDHPLKIKRFYLPSSSTRSLLFDLYTGPVHQAVLYQIPLARLGEKNIFSPTQRFLDPKTTALWLDEENYKSLEPQLDVHTVIADSNPEISDASLEALIRKFPHTTHLSLYNCQGITNQGVIHALQVCNRLQSLDLTNCLGIDTNLLFSEEVREHLPKFSELILTGTQMRRETVELFKRDYHSITYEADALLHPPKAMERNREYVDILKEPEMQLRFMVSQEQDPPSPSFRVHAPLLYAQSAYFRNALRPGGEIFKNTEVDFVNIHATPSAAEAFIQLLHGKLEIETLKWRIAANLAELIGPKNFQLYPSHYQDLLKHIHSHFNLNEAEDFFMAAFKLEDWEGINEYELLLINYVEGLGQVEPTAFEEISVLAQTYNLQKLTEVVNTKTLLYFQDLG